MDDTIKITITFNNCNEPEIVQLKCVGMIFFLKKYSKKNFDEKKFCSKKYFCQKTLNVVFQIFDMYTIFFYM